MNSATDSSPGFGAFDDLRAALPHFHLPANGARNGVYQLSQPALERAEQRRRVSGPPGSGARSQHAAGEAAVLVGQLDKTRQHAGYTQLVGVAAVDPGEQGFRQVVHRLGSVMLQDEVGHGFVAGLRPGRAQQLHPHAEFRFPAQQAGGEERQNPGGHHHQQPVGQGHEAAALADISDALTIVRADDLIGQPQLANQFESGGLGRQEAIRAGLDGAALDALGLDHAPQARPRFEDGGGHAAPGQIVGGRKPGDAAADDDYARHGWPTAPSTAVTKPVGRRKRLPHRVLHHSRALAAWDDSVGRAPRPAVDPRVDLLQHRTSRTRGSGADGGVRPTSVGQTLSSVNPCTFTGTAWPPRPARR